MTDELAQMMKTGHALVQHDVHVVENSERWSWWGCRCGVRYDDAQGGFARRTLARKLHKVHLAEVAEVTAGVESYG